MTLYYPSGLYGPICDIAPPTEVEFVARQIILDEPNLGAEITEEEEELSSQRISPRICRTVQVRNLLTGDGYGPICDVPNFFNDDGTGSNNLTELCADLEDDDFIPLYNPLSDNGIGSSNNVPFPNLGLDIPQLECEISETEIDLPDGTTQVIQYFANCRPVVGEYSGPNPIDAGLQATQPPINYQYRQSLICGALDYYSSPGVYTNTIPVGINAVSIIIFGAGGGAGGGDAANGPTGSGNNSGGSGSFAYLTVSLDILIRNKLKIVVGGGGPSGKSYDNKPRRTLPGWNRGGYGGYAGPSGVSGYGGGGGGSTDVYVNERLVASIAGGGGGGGNGCNYFEGSQGKPWGNWDNYDWNEDLETTSDALIRSRFTPVLMARSVFEPTVKHSLWGDWFKDYVVWFNDGEYNYAGQELENRVNLEFPVSGSYTFEMQADNQMGVYIAPWYDPGEGSYVSDILYNGTFVAQIGDELMSDGNGFITPPSTLPNPTDGAQDWTRVGWTSEFRAANPDTSTYNISSPGRYVIRVIVGNGTNATSENDWQRNPAGFALKIKKPDGSTLWSTKEGQGKDGQNLTSGDGGGGGGGGGNEGKRGLTGDGMGLTGGSCSDRDSTGQGGSAGWSFVLDHPAVSLEYFDQAPGGFHSGWNTPTNADASLRKGGGGFGGGRPQRFTFIFDNQEYSLYTNAGSPREITIPGMGTGVWEDFMNGRTFQYHYFWGVTKDGAPEGYPSGLTDGTIGYLFFGSYQGERNSDASERSSLYRGRSLELALQWTPIRNSSNNWSTRVRLVGIPPWGKGTGFAENDILPGRMPPSKSQGTQPWWDIVTADSDEWHVLRFPDPSDNNTLKRATKSGTSFSFSIKIDDVRTRDDYQPSDGRHGFVRTQYLSVDTQIEGEAE